MTWDKEPPSVGEFLSSLGVAHQPSLGYRCTREIKEKSKPCKENMRQMKKIDAIQATREKLRIKILITKKDAHKVILPLESFEYPEKDKDDAILNCADSIVTQRIVNTVESLVLQLVRFDKSGGEANKMSLFCLIQPPQLHSTKVHQIAKKEKKPRPTRGWHLKL